MRSALIYCSQTGFTERYAQWLGEDTGLTPVAFKQRKFVDLAALDTLIFCSWLHASSIIESRWLLDVMKNHPTLAVGLLLTGATPPSASGDPAPEVRSAVERTFPPEDFPNLTWFYCHGGFAFDRLGFADKIAMRLFFKINERQAKTDPEARAMVEGMRAGFDGTDRAALKPIEEWLQTLDTDSSQRPES